ncbi:MAG: GYD domain-containing protein [Tepidiformaceae bacterium]
MPQHIVLLTLTTAGREPAVDDPQSIVTAASSISMPGVQCLGLYGVLGRFDFVTILDAPDNESAARFSLEMGVRAGASVETLPAVRIGLLGRGAGALAAEEPEPVSRTKD